MEKTLEIRLAEQRDIIHEAIINEPAPEMTLIGQMIWEKARITFARLALETIERTEFPE